MFLIVSFFFCLVSFSFETDKSSLTNNGIYNETQSDNILLTNELLTSFSESNPLTINDITVKFIQILKKDFWLLSLELKFTVKMTLHTQIIIQQIFFHINKYHFVSINVL